VARTLSIWSIAGMTVARFGVPCKKNNVVFEYLAKGHLVNKNEGMSEKIPLRHP
jgi:hypothetical protein